MTQTTPEQRQRLRDLCRKITASGAHLRWETSSETMAEYANAALPAVPALLSGLDAAEAEIERLKEELSAHTRDLSGDDHFDSNEAVAQLLDAEILFVGTSRGHTTLYVICNDLFAWGLADAEPFSTADIPDLYSAWKSGEWGVEKWCCKRRNMQPQPPVKRSMIEDGAWDESMESLPQNPSARTALENKP